MYDTLKQICDLRKSARKFSNKKICDELIKKILDVAYTSPFASGRKSWKIITITDEHIISQLSESVKNAIINFNDKIKNEYKDFFIKYSKNFIFFENCPVLLIPVFKNFPILSYIMNNEDNSLEIFERDNYTKSIACVSTLILLAAESLKLKACMMTGPLIAETEIKNILNINVNLNVGAIIPIGYEKELNNE